MQLAFLRHIVSILKQRVSNFYTSLIKDGKKEALLHGYLSFFKHLFEDFKVETTDLSRQDFLNWRSFVHELMTTSL